MISAVWLALAAAPLPVPELVRRTEAMMDRQPAHLVCRVSSVVDVLDKNGKPEDHTELEIEETRRGEKIDHKVLRSTKNGADNTAEAQAGAARRAQEPKTASDGGLVTPFTRAGSPHYRYSLVREETLWGRRAFLFEVMARQRRPNVGIGSVWIDAERFTVMKAELAPAKLPSGPVDWLKLHSQYQLLPSGFVVPTFVKVEGAGSMLFTRTGFRSTMTWKDCQTARASSSGAISR